ncbi:PPC domain-containing protein [Spirulina major]|uniref:PPC domain-containing protein n=1 Tax=Spirulina major TaxID=270636 RepID=UPI000932DE4C|nr:PPC domain-containing protein [Spirulina major]
MKSAFNRPLPLALLTGIAALGLGALTPPALAGAFCGPTAKSTVQQKQQCQRPTLTSGQDFSDVLTDQDIPTGDGGFFRDYEVNLQPGDNVAIDLVSNEFDPIVLLLNPDGTPLGDNDDAPGGGTDSLLFTRIKEAGTYIVRVRSFGDTGGGEFTLTVTRLVPVR